MNKDRYWMGYSDTEFLVFDRNIQIPDSPFVYLWSHSSKSIERYVPDKARPFMKSHKPDGKNSDEISRDALEGYERWYAAHSTLWLQEERNYVKDRREKEKVEEERIKDAQQALEQRHAEHLAKYGIAGAGTRAASTSRGRRITHCWRCTSPLDSSIDLECTMCGWILCYCGACGCGYASS